MCDPTTPIRGDRSLMYSRGKRSRVDRVRVYVIAFATLLAIACSRPPPDATPDGAVRLWLDKMEAATDDPRAMRDAWTLLGPVARANLQARAERASRVEGRRVEPFEMLAEGRFGLSFRPKSMTPTIKGDRASVEVTGSDPTNEHATVQCAHEANGWRVEPDLPEVVALPKRTESGN
jgi:hypothetical protein